MSAARTAFRDEFYKATGLFPELTCGYETYECARSLLRRFQQGGIPESGAFVRGLERISALWKTSLHKGGFRTLTNGVSAENWMLKRKHKPSDTNENPGEVGLEFQLANSDELLAENENAAHCGSSVAASSGLFGQQHGSNWGLTQIDLIRLTNTDAGEMIELKLKKLNLEESPSKIGLQVVVSACFQVAIYAALLTFWHSQRHELGLDAAFIHARPVLERRHWHLKTLANAACFTSCDMRTENGSCRGLLRALSDWLGEELNRMACENESRIIGGSLSFQHSFHSYGEELIGAHSVQPGTLAALLKSRWDTTTKV